MQREVPLAGKARLSYNEFRARFQSGQEVPHLQEPASSIPAQLGIPMAEADDPIPELFFHKTFQFMNRFTTRGASHRLSKTMTDSAEFGARPETGNWCPDVVKRI